MTRITDRNGVKGQSEKAGEEAPWDESTLAKHKAAKEAPSALNAVVVPNMTLPAVSSPTVCISGSSYADGVFRTSTTGSTSGARRATLKFWVPLCVYWRA